MRDSYWKAEIDKMKNKSVRKTKEKKPVILQDAATGTVLALIEAGPGYLKRARKKGVISAVVDVQKRKVKGAKAVPARFKVKEFLENRESGAVLIKVAATVKKRFRSGKTGFGENLRPAESLESIEKKVRTRRSLPRKSSKTSRLFLQGTDRIAKKLGEEAVELVIEAKDKDDRRLLAEACDLIYYFLVLLAWRDIRLADVVRQLGKRKL